MERISKTRTVWSRDALASKFPWGAHARACMVFLWWWLDASDQCVSLVPMTGTKCIQRRKRSPGAGIPELDEIVLAA